MSKEEVRHIMLNSQGLVKPQFGGGVTGTMNAIRHLGYVQLDTLAVVARAHHHTLWNRNKSYTEFHLDALLRAGKVFEYWSHAASYLPMEDFRFSLPRKALYLSGHAHWFAKNKKLMAYVLDRIRAEGPLQSKDFETDRKRGSWFDWKPAKIALEQLFMEGSVMVKSRQGFQKIYDLTERVVPDGIDQSKPTKEAYAEYLVSCNIRALGVASIKDFVHLRKDATPAVSAAIKRLVKNGAIREIEVDGTTEKYFTSFPENGIKSLHKTLNILSPFDNLVIRRDRLQKLFDWEYTLECYLPEHKRRFGYFNLPVLFRGKFVAMFDPKADRSTGKFHLKKFHPVKDKMTDEFYDAFRNELKAFAAYNGCDQVVVDNTVPIKFRKQLK